MNTSVWIVLLAAAYIVYLAAVALCLLGLGPVGRAKLEPNPFMRKILYFVMLIPLPLLWSFIEEREGRAPREWMGVGIDRISKWLAQRHSEWRAYLARINEEAKDYPPVVLGPENPYKPRSAYGDSRKD